jgi:hypothetical protein
MRRESEVTDLRGGDKVAVVGGRSGIVLFWESGYEGKRGALRDSDLRSAKGT